MPFRDSGAFGSQQYPTFADPNGFDFTYDIGSDSLLSPYSFPLMSPDASWTPASQQFAAPNLSDSLSPLGVADFTTPPQDQDLHFPPSASDAGLSEEHASTSRMSFSDSKQHTPGTMKTYDNLFHGQKRNASFLGLDSPPVTNMSTASVDRKQMLSNPADSPGAVPIKTRQSSSDASPEGSHEDAPQSAADNGAAARLRTTDSAKVRHNIVERRYRENINAQVDLLRESIVATVHAKEEQQGVSTSRLGSDELKRLTKAAVIGAATKQIRRARTENERLLDENRALQAQVQELESLVKCGDCPLMKLTVDLSLDSPTQPP